MQQTRNADKGQRFGVEEKLIHFKSSPNFKNMKKFLKTRMGDNSDPFGSPTMEMTDSSPHQEEIQPPLPLEPPPPDELPQQPQLLPSKVEQEEENLYFTVLKQECASPEPDIKPEDEDQMDIVEEAKVLGPICKDFIRGSCARIDCRYRHEVDLDQLRGIFTFCHNFQNNVCVKPNCRFVHATVFEEQRFYRTGQLPKVLTQKTENQMQPPPPPPPPNATESEITKDPVDHTFIVNVSKPPPQIIAKPEEQLINGMFNPNLGKNPNIDPNKSPSASIKPGIPGWMESDEGRIEFMKPSSPHDNEPRAKHIYDGRCSSCKVMEHRWKFAARKLEEISKSATESELKILKLKKRHKFLIQTTMAMAQANKKRDHLNLGQQMPSQRDQILQQMFTLSDCLAQMKDDERRTSSTALFTNLKQLIQSQTNINKINNNDENGPKAYQLATQHLMQQLEPPSSSSAQYQMQTGANGTAANEQSPVRHSNMDATRQLTNLMNGW